MHTDRLFRRAAPLVGPLVGCRLQLIENKAEKNLLQTGRAGPRR
jgi:hypothetical protein